MIATAITSSVVHLLDAIHQFRSSRGLVGRCSKRQTRVTHLKEKTMDEELQIEWGPAHLRDETPAVVYETVERPDDN